MHKPAPHEYPQGMYFSRYIEAVDDQNLAGLLTRQMQTVLGLFETLNETQKTFRYEPGKWSPKEMLGHLTDTERIFAYRLLAIARGEQQSLPGFDENTYAETAQFDQQPLAGLLRQYELTRLGTLELIASFDDTAWERRGTSNNTPVSVRLLAWLIAGHERHHLNILRDRYGFIPPVL